FSSRRRHTRWPRDWSSDVCSSDLPPGAEVRRMTASRRSATDKGRSAPRLYLVSPSLDTPALAAKLAEALAAADVAAVLARGPAEIGRASCRERVEYSV